MNQVTAPRFRNPFRESGFKAGFTIYAKALLIFSLAILLLFGTLFFFTEGFILSQFAEVEQIQMREEARRLVYLFEQEAGNLKSSAADWGQWDEIYGFVTGKNPTFPALNLNPESISNLRVDFLGIWNLKGRLLAWATPDAAPTSQSSLADSALLESQSGRLLQSLEDSATRSGNILLDRQLVTVAEHQVTDSLGQAPPVGVILVGRTWTPTRLGTLLPPGSGTLSILHLSRALSDPSWRDPAIRLLATGRPVIFSPDSEFICALILLRSPEGTPLCALVLQKERELYRIANRSVRIFLLAMTAAGGSVLILVWFVIDRNILNRLARIDHAVRSLRQTGKFPADLDTKSADELGHLARGIQDLTFSLQESESALRDLSGRLLRLQDDERRRIARELHDSTAQNLSALEMNLSLLEKSTPPENTALAGLLASSREIAASCSREIRTLSYLLHPPLLDEVGLAFAIRWFVEGYTTRTGIDVDLRLPEDFPRFPPDLETTLFRILQESLTNVYRHSGSTSASISLQQDKQSVVLEIKDRGRGFSPHPHGPAPGLGLMGMRERVRQQGGFCEIHSDSRGTRIRVSIPLEANEPIPPLDSPAPRPLV